MQNLFTKLIACCVIGTGILNANCTGLVIGVVTGGLKGSSKVKQARDQKSKISPLERLYMYTVQGASCEESMAMASAGTDLIFTWKFSDWLEIGSLQGLVGNFDWNLKNASTKITIHEKCYFKLGCALKHHNVLFSFGLKIGYRTGRLKKKKTEYKSLHMTDRRAFGWFHQTMLLIPLADRNWKLILMKELYGDLRGGRFTASVQAKQSIEDQPHANLQTGFRLGMGIGYCFLGQENG